MQHFFTCHNNFLAPHRGYDGACIIFPSGTSLTTRLNHRLPNLAPVNMHNITFTSLLSVHQLKKIIIKISTHDGN